MAANDYSRYLRSSHWRKLRARYQRERPWVCVCGATESLELHHKTYDRLGAEELDDLQPLCQPCHSLLHGLAKQTGSLDPENVFDVLRAAQYRATRPDLYDKPPGLTREQRAALNRAIIKARKSKKRTERKLDPEKVRKYGGYLAKQ